MVQQQSPPRAGASAEGFDFDSDESDFLQPVSAHDMMILEECWVVLDSVLRFVEISNVKRRQKHSGPAAASGMTTTSLSYGTINTTFKYRHDHASRVSLSSCLRKDPNKPK